MKLHLKGDWHLQVQPVLDLWKALNRGINLTELPTSRSGGDSHSQPVDAFVSQELNFAVRLARNVHKTLAAINQTIRGNTRPSPTVSDTVLHLIRLQVWYNHFALPKGSDPKGQILTALPNRQAHFSVIYSLGPLQKHCSKTNTLIATLKV